MKWQPIETAPRDGTDVLLYDSFEPAVCKGWFHDGEWLPSRGPNFWKQPTHWAPLELPVT